MLCFGPFRLDVAQRLLFREEEEIVLTPKVFDTLLVLVEHHGRVLEKDYLMRTIWPNSFVEETSLARNISLLRKILGECPEDQKFIQTIPRRGYRFVAPVDAQVGDETASALPESGAAVPQFAFVPVRDVTTDAGPGTASASRSHFRVGTTPARPTGPLPAARSRFSLYLGAFGLLFLTVGGLLTWKLWRTLPLPVIRAVILLSPDERLGPTLDVPVVLSPDGSRLAYVAQKGSELPRIFVRELNQLGDRPLEGTERANHPFFSPDGQWIGFFSNGNLKKVSLAGGAVITICLTGGDLRGAAWGPDDNIIFGTNGSAGLMQVSAAGGTPEPLTTVAIDEGETSHRWPEILPNGEAVLFVVGTGRDYDNANIAVQRFDRSKHKVLLQGGTFPQYVSTGHLVFARAGNLLAAPLDLTRLEVLRPPEPVMEEVLAPSSPIGAAQFTISNTGTLAYIPRTLDEPSRSLVWVDRGGHVTPLKVAGQKFGNISNPRLSPDGQFAAVQSNEPTRDILLYSFERETMTRLTFEGINSLPMWTPDGQRLVYQSTKSGNSNLFWQPIHGKGPEEPLTPSSPGTQYPGSFTADGRLFLFSEILLKTRRDIFVLPVDGERPPSVFLQTPYDETTPQLSPDGRYVAYVSDESGRNEVYVQPFGSSGTKFRISTDGGSEILWGENGEIFYRADNHLMAVPVRTHPTLEIGKPQRLFEGPYLRSSGRSTNFDVSADGQRFLMLKLSDLQASTPPQIHIVLNWFEELKHLVAVE
jgi:serine/threonine-protein kinase